MAHELRLSEVRHETSTTDPSVGGYRSSAAASPGHGSMFVLSLPIAAVCVRATCMVHVRSALPPIDSDPMSSAYRSVDGAGATGTCHSSIGTMDDTTRYMVSQQLPEEFATTTVSAS